MGRAKIDPAYALGPNINAPMEEAAIPEVYAAIQQAQKLAAHISPREQAYIQALSNLEGTFMVVVDRLV